VAEPGRITTSVYNGQPDPFNGNALASCAPTAALLPDGKPIAVLCKQVEQATTDTDGHLGFSAALQGGVANRTSSWTYNQYGQVLTEDGPRTDVSDVTTYTYYSDTSFTGSGAAAEGHYPGDLQSMTNAASKVTNYGKYNKHGQLLESTDPNGVLTVNTYDLRQRLLSTTVGGQTTSYSYDPAGQLKKVTLPDTSWVGYDYDDAHRQIAVYDNKGNRTDYVLDNAGNRTGENTKDPSGNLKRQLSRSIDALGRVQQTTGREE
jgi:YD repeat-containing protein